ncbi:hypothetical protein ACFQHO_44810 [Actinomadura yumaensis]|uniref:hypothetical protein n=1 Tax=Actinomadura yumaensis TaxID=111807 RepID=UPI00360ABFBE
MAELSWPAAAYNSGAVTDAEYQRLPWDADGLVGSPPRPATPSTPTPAAARSTSGPTATAGSSAAPGPPAAPSSPCRSPPTPPA